MWSRWTEKARKAVWATNDMAAAQGQPEIAVEQLLFALLREDNTACRLLAACHVDIGALRARVLHALPQPEAAGTDGDEPVQWRWMKPVLDAAYATAWDLNTNYIGTEHLLLALLKHPSPAQTLLQAAGLKGDAVRRAWFEFREQDKA